MVKSTLIATTHIDYIDEFEHIDVEVKDGLNTPKDKSFNSLDRFQLQDIEIEKSERVLSKVEASLKPQISLSGYFGYNYDIDDSLHKENLWQIGLNLTWNIFDFNRGDAREQQARVAKLQAVIQKKRLSEDFNKMLAEAVDRVESSVAEYKINLAQLKLLEETRI